MTKYLLLLSAVFSFSLFAQDFSDEESSFEAELRILESRDEMAFNRAEVITQKELQKDSDFVTDSVSTSNAGVQKEDRLTLPAPAQLKMTPPAFKTRRIRSR